MSNQISLPSHRSKGVKGMYNWRVEIIHKGLQQIHYFLLSWHRGFRSDLMNAQIQHDVDLQLHVSVPYQNSQRM